MWAMKFVAAPPPVATILRTSNLSIKHPFHKKITVRFSVKVSRYIQALVASLFASLLLAAGLQAAERQPGDYPFTPDSLVQPGVKQGELRGPFEFHSKILANTVRRYWVYVPANYDPKQPPNLLVFHDGQRATNPKGSLRVQVVLDNLIHKGDIPPTLGLFITPGNLSEKYPDDLGMSNPDNRAQ